MTSNKLVIGVGIIALVIAGWVIFQTSTVDYASSVNDEVIQLEAELAEIDASLVAGTLTPEKAQEARVKIATRLATINTAMEDSQSATLTTQQRITLVEGLARLKDVLTRHSTTLVSVENAADQAPSVVEARQSGGSRTSIVASLTETISTIQDYVEEIATDALNTDEAPVEEVDATVSGEDILDDTTADTPDDMGDIMDTPVDEDVEVGVEMDVSVDVEMTDSPEENPTN